MSVAEKKVKNNNNYNNNKPQNDANYAYNNQ